MGPAVAEHPEARRTTTPNITTNVIKNYLQGKAEQGDLEEMIQPPQSPDLNFIQSVWDFTKQQKKYENVQDPGPSSSYLSISSVQNQVDEVIDVMQENITKVIERGERLDELQDKSESLSDNATAFSSRARQLRRQMWWRECKD
ncbi:unnamed protein product [Ranitomeya imitator]|uniref:V-SNARE coiled-coil homology domain-containing protein n=1 Tax=Ranitomeya imitator TaxID=111125 RepID=A0ABN9LIY6_9NEOB|nr:unnamed protein product [Ranitomeya imitator]